MAEGRESTRANFQPVQNASLSNGDFKFCPICDNTIGINPGEPGGMFDTVFCAGKCQSFLHRNCAGLTKQHFEAVAHSKEPYLCTHCRLTTVEQDSVRMKEQIESLLSFIQQMRTAFTSISPQLVTTSSSEQPSLTRHVPFKASVPSLVSLHGNSEDPNANESCGRNTDYISNKKALSTAEAVSVLYCNPSLALSTPSTKFISSTPTLRASVTNSTLSREQRTSKSTSSPGHLVHVVQTAAPHHSTFTSMNSLNARFIASHGVNTSQTALLPVDSNNRQSTTSTSFHAKTGVSRTTLWRRRKKAAQLLAWIGKRSNGPPNAVVPVIIHQNRGSLPAAPNQLQSPSAIVDDSHMEPDAVARVQSSEGPRIVQSRASIVQNEEPLLTTDTECDEMHTNLSSVKTPFSSSGDAQQDNPQSVLIDDESRMDHRDHDQDLDSSSSVISSHAVLRTYSCTSKAASLEDESVKSDFDVATSGLIVMPVESNDLPEVASGDGPTTACSESVSNVPTTSESLVVTIVSPVTTATAFDLPDATPRSLDTSSSGYSQNGMSTPYDRMDVSSASVEGANVSPMANGQSGSLLDRKVSRTTIWRRKKKAAAQIASALDSVVVQPKRRAYTCMDCSQPSSLEGHKQYFGLRYCPYLPGQVPFEDWLLHKKSELNIRKQCSD